MAVLKYVLCMVLYHVWCFRAPKAPSVSSLVLALSGSARTRLLLFGSERTVTAVTEKACVQGRAAVERKGLQEAVP